VLPAPARRPDVGPIFIWATVDANVTRIETRWRANRQDGSGPVGAAPHGLQESVVRLRSSQLPRSNPENIAKVPDMIPSSNLFVETYWAATMPASI